MNTHFCFIWLFKLGRQGRIIPKIQLCLESILNLPQIQKTLAIWVRRWTHTLCFLPFPCKWQHNVDMNYMEQQRPNLSDGNSERHPLSREASQKSVTKGWDCFPPLCRSDFFGSHFISRSWFSELLPPCASWNKNILDLKALCAVEESVSRGMCLAAGAERHRWHSSLGHCTLSTLRELVSFLRSS